MILDDYLVNYTGANVANALYGVPIVLVLRQSQWKNQVKPLPTRVCRFVHKKYGAEKIITEAIKVVLKQNLLLDSADVFPMDKSEIDI